MPQPERTIDPRFDPRYQRGYSPADEPAVDRFERDERMPPPPAPISHTPASAPAVVEPTSAAVNRHEIPVGELALPEPRRPDPWLIGGWVIALIAVLVGASLVVNAVVVSFEVIGRPQTPEERVTSILGWFIAPALLQAGSLGIVAMLVVSAIRWSRRHQEPGVES